MDIQNIKQQFEIIGNNPELNRAIEVAIKVAPVDISVLINGESGVGKEVFPRIIHKNSSRKHGQYIAVNCGAIPEGTIDSELFGHEKGAFTGATDSRKGYFEVANNGTIFLDEVGELPLSTQVRLLRVLETGEFIRVGSSKPQKTNVRVVAATNVNMQQAVAEGKFREDLYYRLNTVPIFIPPLRARGNDIYLLFRKFAKDSAEKFKMPTLILDENAQVVLQNYRWPGNVRQLKNITEQIAIIEKQRDITADTLRKYLPNDDSNQLPAIYNKVDEQTFNSEREILYKILFDMKKDMNDLKKLVHDLMDGDVNTSQIYKDNAHIISTLHDTEDVAFNVPEIITPQPTPKIIKDNQDNTVNIQDTEEFIEESLSLADKEKEMIEKALERHNGKRKYAAQDLGISERTLYRKLKELNLE